MIKKLATSFFIFSILASPVLAGTSTAPCLQILAELPALNGRSSNSQISDALKEILKELKVSSLEEMKASLEAGEPHPLPSLADTASGSVRRALHIIYEKVDVKKVTLKKIIDQLIEEKSSKTEKRRKVRNERKNVDWITKRFNTDGPIHSSPTFYKDGKRLLIAVSGWDDHLYIWDVNSKEKVAKIYSRRTLSTSPVFYKAGNRLLVAAGYRERHLGVWDVNSKEHVAKLKTKGPASSPPVFYQDGKRLLIAARSHDDHIYVWDLNSKGIVAKFKMKTHLGEDSPIAFYRDKGRLLIVASVGSGDLYAWDLNSKQKEPTKFEVNIDVAPSSKHYRDGDRLLHARGMPNDYFSVFDAPGASIPIFKIQIGDVWQSPAFFRNGNRLLIGAATENSRLHILDLSSKKVVAKFKTSSPIVSPPTFFKLGGQFLIAVTLDENQLKLFNLAEALE